MINDQAAGLAAKVLSGTPRDSLHAVGVVLRQQGGVVPEAIITDTGSYSDIVFGMLHLFGRQYRPQLANLPDQRLWRIDPAADYSPLDRAARAAASTSTGSPSTGRTCAGSRCRSTPVRCPRTRSPG
jgi:TnpA family transposase